MFGNFRGVPYVLLHYVLLPHITLTLFIKCFILIADDECLEPGSQRQYSLVDFELIRVIGRGSYAKVLMVELKKTHRIYAMKVIKKALVTDDEVSRLS
jgi:serine/threonine protein kinase